MSLESMFSSLEKDADIEKKKFQDDADREISAIRSETELRSKQIHDRLMAKTKEEMDIDEAKILGSARLKANAMQLDSRKKAFEDVSDLAKARVQKASQDPVYPQTLAGLIQESLLGLSGKVVVEVSERDLNLAQEIIKKLQKSGAFLDLSEIEVKSANNIASGTIVRALDMKLIINDTLETRLAKVLSSLTTDIADKFWPNKT